LRQTSGKAIALPITACEPWLSFARLPESNSAPCLITQFAATHRPGIKFGVSPSSAITASSPSSLRAITTQHGVGIHERAW